MRYITVFLVGLLILGLAIQAEATGEGILRQKLAEQFEKATAGARIYGPAPGIATRAPGGPELYRRVVNGVVYIWTGNGVTGSGAVISSTGWIVTNWHVVRGESRVGIIFRSSIPLGRRAPRLNEDYFLATVVKIDALRDLALLKLDTPPPLTPLPLGRLSYIEVGQDVFSVSHPEGLLWSYTEGVISQVRPDSEWKSAVGTPHKATLIQTQTVVSPGSSGAPLFDMSGRLIGIFVSTVGQGLNFAIAVNEVQEFLLVAIESGR